MNILKKVLSELEEIDGTLVFGTIAACWFISVLVMMWVYFIKDILG